jgi:hypothetical protein
MRELTPAVVSLVRMQEAEETDSCLLYMQHVAGGSLDFHIELVDPSTFTEVP